MLPLDLVSPQPEGRYQRQPAAQCRTRDAIILSTLFTFTVSGARWRCVDTAPSSRRECHPKMSTKPSYAQRPRLADALRAPAAHAAGAMQRACRRSIERAIACASQTLSLPRLHKLHPEVALGPVQMTQVQVHSLCSCCCSSKLMARSKRTQLHHPQRTITYASLGKPCHASCMFQYCILRRKLPHVTETAAIQVPMCKLLRLLPQLLLCVYAAWAALAWRGSHEFWLRWREVLLTAQCFFAMNGEAVLELQHTVTC